MNHNQLTMQRLNTLVASADLGLALLALGSFVQYRLDDGMALADIEPFMQAYLNLSAVVEGRACQDLHALQAQIVDVGPIERASLNEVWPSWLPDAEKLRQIRRSSRNGQNTCGHYIQSE